MDEPKIETTPWNAADYIETPEDVVEFLKAALEENDPKLLTDALAIVAQAQGMAALARRVGVTRESLLQTEPGASPGLAPLLKIMEAMGLHLDVRAKDADPAAA